MRASSGEKFELKNNKKFKTFLVYYFFIHQKLLIVSVLIEISAQPIVLTTLHIAGVQ